MPIATPEVYAQMLDAAKERSFAYPAINVSSSQTLNAALKGFADAGSDGIIQVSTGGAEYLSGPSIKDMVTGSVAFAAYAAEVAKNYPVNIALHTDHCPQGKLDGFVRQLLDISAERVARGEAPLFQSHMWDGSSVPLDENLQIAEELLAEAAAANVVLEIEVGVVGGEDDRGRAPSAYGRASRCHVVPRRLVVAGAERAVELVLPVDVGAHAAFPPRVSVPPGETERRRRGLSPAGQLSVRRRARW